MFVPNRDAPEFWPHGDGPNATRDGARDIGKAGKLRLRVFRHFEKRRDQIIHSGHRQADFLVKISPL